ncbi:MAG TPA: FKBP-type peptidyl-prolyl cis-trans isomerase [Candidatus Dormibacteraeota bacterium]|nr:FKBP-type peptidyl-prolyl cis-trans isomerase [Candidatus Dormibacteraeota bacterium]
MTGIRAGLLLASAALLAGCGGEVANTTSGNLPATSTAAPAATANPGGAAQCNPNGIDSSVTDKGPDDKFDEGASVAGSTTPDGLKTVDLKQGTGPTVQSMQCITVQYTGWLENGIKFDSSRDRVGGFQFVVGAGNVIPGWDKGIPGMKVGGHRRLTIPAALGYGAAGSPPTIPANATLMFDVEVLKVVG